MSSREFSKFKEDEDDKDEKKKKETTKIKKRKPKELVYQDCKDDLKHIFYINHKAQQNVRHSLMPNMTLEDCPMEDFTQLPRYNLPHCKITEPHPVYIAKKHCDRLDPCFRRTIARSSYINRMSQARKAYETASKNSRQLRKLEKEEAYSPIVFTLAERLERNPDPFFYGNYDYYYTGGNLCVLSSQDEYILHVDDMNAATIRISTFPQDNDLSGVFLKEFTSKRLPNDSEIFEIAPLVNINGHMDNIAGVRQRNTIAIFKILPKSKNIILTNEFRTSKTPFISFAQSSDKPEMFVISNMKEKVRAYDITRKNVNLTNLCRMKDDKTSISWNRVTFWKNQTFLYANERQISVMDLRTSEKDFFKSNCSFSSKEFPCESISSFRKSQFEHLIYIGTTHKLLCLDTRMLGKQRTFEDTSICEWTHQLDYPPLLLDIHHTNKREFIAAASPIAGDLRLCELTRALNANCLSESLYKSYCLPWQPPTLQEAYESACLAGKTLQPEADFKHRMQCCTTGLTFYKTRNHGKSKTIMLWANSNGDVYEQKFDRPDPTNSCYQRISQRSNEIMAKYASTAGKLAQPDLNYTDVVNFKAMRKILLCSNLSGDLSNKHEEFLEENENVKLRKRFKGRWQKSVNNLYSYKDALAQDLLSIWDVPKEDDIDIKYSELKKKFKEEKNQKDILKWLNSDQAPAHMISAPITNLNMSASIVNEDGFLTPANVTDSALQEHNVTQISASGNELNDYSINESFSMPKNPKLAKPKKKYVMGF